MSKLANLSPRNNITKYSTDICMIKAVNFKKSLHRLLAKMIYSMKVKEEHLRQSFMLSK